MLQAMNTGQTLQSNVMPNRSVGRYGLYTKDGQPIAIFTSFLDADTTGMASIATQPIEEGGFFSVNKTVDAQEIKITMAVSGDDATLAQTWETLEQYRQDTELVSVVTPYYTLLNMNLVKVNNVLKRENGVGLLIVGMDFEEVRQVEAQYTNVSLPPAQVKNPNSASTKDSGLQQGKPVPYDSPLAQISNRLNGSSVK